MAMRWDTAEENTAGDAAGGTAGDTAGDDGTAGDGSTERSASVVVVAGAPLGKMHAWRFDASDLDPVKRRSKKLPGERMPDLRYLDQTPMSDPLDVLAFACTGDDVVAVTHDGLVV